LRLVTSSAQPAGGSSGSTCAASLGVVRDDQHLLAGQHGVVEALELAEFVGELCLPLEGADDALECLLGGDRVRRAVQLDEELRVRVVGGEALGDGVGQLGLADPAKTANAADAGGTAVRGAERRHELLDVTLAPLEVRHRRAELVERSKALAGGVIVGDGDLRAASNRHAGAAGDRANRDLVAARRLVPFLLRVLLAAIGHRRARWMEGLRAISFN
jgi:hypothetical protein